LFAGGCALAGQFAMPSVAAPIVITAMTVPIVFFMSSPFCEVRNRETFSFALCYLLWRTDYDAGLARSRRIGEKSEQT